LDYISRKAVEIHWLDLWAF